MRWYKRHSGWVGKKAPEEYGKSGCLHDEHWHCRPELRNIRILVGLVPVTLCNREKQVEKTSFAVCPFRGCTCLSDCMSVRVLTNMEKWIMLNNGTSCCSEGMASSESPFHWGIAWLAQSLISLSSVSAVLEMPRPRPWWATGVSSWCFCGFSLQSKANQIQEK